MIDAALEHTTAMTMSSNFNTVGGNSVVDELEVTMSTTIYVF